MFSDRIRLDGKVALITGSGRGIGLAIAEAFADCGAAVAVQDIDLNVAQVSAEQINQRGGGRAIALGGDINDLTLPDRLVNEVNAKLGGFHILVNNASIQSSDNWLNVSVEKMQQEFGADLISPILFCQAAARIMKPQRYGRIINLGSIQQVTANAKMLAYSLSKSAIEKLSTCLARELAKDMITVNTIAPGWVAGTVRNEGNFKNEQDKIEKGKKHIPLGRVGEPSDCAGTAVLLCSEAGEYITGQTIYITGGMGF